MAKRIKWHRVGDREYEAVLDGQTVAHAVNTSATGTDNYPWDWHLTDSKYPLAERTEHGSRTGGVADTLRSVKDTVAWALLGHSDV